MLSYVFLWIPFYDTKNKERELKAKEAELNRREKVLYF